MNCRRNLAGQQQNKKRPGKGDDAELASMQPSSNLQQRLKDLQRHQETVINTVEAEDHIMTVKVEDNQAELPSPVSEYPGNGSTSVQPQRMGR
jgi:hypothetical protein